MKIANKLSIFRIVAAILIIILIGFNWSLVNVTWPVYLIGGKVILRLNYLISGGLFLFASLFVFLYSLLSKNKNEVDANKTLDIIADKILINSTLIVLAYNHDISLFVPVIIVIRDIVVEALRAMSSSKGKEILSSQIGKTKTVVMMCGLALVLFENLPMEFFGIALDQLLILIACVLSIYSAIEYYYVNKELQK